MNLLLTDPTSSLALISARATLNALEVLSLLTSSFLYALCQALDLRAMQHEFELEVNEILREQLAESFGPYLSSTSIAAVTPLLLRQISRSLETTSTMDAVLRMRTVAATTTTPLVDFCAQQDGGAHALAEIVAFRAALAERMTASLLRLRQQYLSGAKGAAPASAYLGKSCAVYEFVRVTLGIRMHGVENLHDFKAGPGVEDPTIGQDISLIHEAIRDGKLQDVVVGLFA